MHNIIDVIKYEGDNSTFIWKHPCEDFNINTQLIVHESQEAVVFVDGQASLPVGPGRYTLDTNNFPLLRHVVHLVTGKETPFHCEVYFINKTVQMALHWGIDSKVRYLDPDSGIPLSLGTHGDMNLSVKDSRKFLLKLVGTMQGIAWDDFRREKASNYAESKQFGIHAGLDGVSAGVTQSTNRDNAEKESLQVGFRTNAADGKKPVPSVNIGYRSATAGERELSKSLQIAFRPLISNTVKSCLPAAIKQTSASIFEVDEHFAEISAYIQAKLVPGFEEYGLTVPEFYVTYIKPDDDDNLARLQNMQGYTLKVREQQAEASLKAAERERKLEEETTATEIVKREAERSLIKAQAEAQKKRMDGLAEAEIMAAKGYTQKDVLGAEVQKAYAEGIGKFGSGISVGGGASIGGSVNAGGGAVSSSGMANDMVSMMVGMKMAGTVLDKMDSMFNIPGTEKKEDKPAKEEKPAEPEKPEKEEKPAQESGGIKCRKCGAPLPAGAKFCFSCGEQIVPEGMAACPRCGKIVPKGKFCLECGYAFEKKCPNCGAVLPEGSKFCLSCGTKIE